MKKILKIEAMHCGGCSTGIELLLNTKGIRAKVDFSTKKAEVEFDPKNISLKEIEKQIENAGYKVK